MKTLFEITIIAVAVAFANAVWASADVMSPAYRAVWNEAEQSRIDADIENNRKADGSFVVNAAPGTTVEVEQVSHAFRFGAHIFYFNQLGKKEWNDRYKALWGEGGLFNQATVAFYWDAYEPHPGYERANGGYEDTEDYWNSVPIEEAPRKPHWRRPAPGPVIEFLKEKNCRVHGHPIIWGQAKPHWLWNDYCPASEKAKLRPWGVRRYTYEDAQKSLATGRDVFLDDIWQYSWRKVWRDLDEAAVAGMMPVFAKSLDALFRRRVASVGKRFGDVVESWDIVNETVRDWVLQRSSRTGLDFWRSVRYGVMPGDYPLKTFLAAKDILPDGARLAINDYDVSADYVEEIGQLREAGARIDIVGVQMHLMNPLTGVWLAEGKTNNVKWAASPGAIRQTLDRIASAGSHIHISEVTIPAPGGDPDSLQIQAELVRNIYRAWFSHPSVMGITWWNTVDDCGSGSERMRSGLLTRDMNPKPAYDVLDALINGEWKTSLSLVPDADGRIAFRGFRGTYRLKYVCAFCGEKHERIVDLDNDGVREETAPGAICYRPILDYMLDGERVRITSGERLDIGARRPGAVKKGFDGTQWATVEFSLDAPADGDYEVGMFNDYFGELSVNGGEGKKTKGPSDDWRAETLRLKAGRNAIRLRTCAGSGGKWECAFALPASSPLKAQRK